MGTLTESLILLCAASHRHTTFADKAPQSSSLFKTGIALSRHERDSQL